MPVEINNKSVLDNIGLPPDSDNQYGRTQRYDFLPLVKITPAIPQLKLGLHAFKLQKANTAFKSDFESTAKNCFNWIKTITLPLKVYFLAETFPSETFQSEYGESFLERFADVASGGLSEIAYMMGARDIGSVMTALEKAAGGASPAWIKAVGGAVGQAREVGEETVRNLIRAGGWQRSLGQTLQFASKLATGGRVDLPQVWKNSSYGVSYAITVRLYNPDPGDAYATEKFILAPLTALLLLVLPSSKRISGGGRTSEATKGIFHFPYLCRLNSPGIFTLPSGFVSSINVIKGGEQGLYGHNQHLGMCDVRLEFGNLYGTMVHGIDDDTMPTLINYIKGLREIKSLKSPRSSQSTLSIRRRTSSTKVEDTPLDMSISPSSRISTSDNNRSNNITSTQSYEDVKDQLIS